MQLLELPTFIDRQRHIIHFVCPWLASNPGHPSLCYKFPISGSLERRVLSNADLQCACRSHKWRGDYLINIHKLGNLTTSKLMAPALNENRHGSLYAPCHATTDLLHELRANWKVMDLQRIRSKLSKVSSLRLVHRLFLMSLRQEKLFLGDH